MLTIASPEPDIIRLTSNDADGDNAGLEDAFAPYPALTEIFEEVEPNEHGDYDIDVPLEGWADLCEALTNDAVSWIPGAAEAIHFIGAALRG